MQGGKWIGRDLGPGSGDPLDQCRFPGVGITDQRCVCDRTQLEKKVTAFALAAFRIFARRAIARAFEMHVTFAARATFAEEKLLAIAGEIGEELDPGVFFCGTTWLFANFTAIDRTFEARNRIIWLLVFNPPSAIHIPQLINHRSNRNLYDFVRRIFAVHFFTAPVSAAFRLDNRLIEKMSKVVRVLISLQDNIAAASAVTPIRSPLGNEFFAPETDTPPSALSGLRKNFDAIDKHDVRHCHREPPVSSLPGHLERKRGTSQRRRRISISGTTNGCSTITIQPWVSGLDALRRQQATLGPSNLVAIYILFIVSSLGH